ncbi:hypothetical protein [Klebsiella pneumoniae]
MLSALEQLQQDHRKGWTSESGSRGMADGKCQAYATGERGVERA